MVTVFIGGSRAVSRLNGSIREQLENLVVRKCAVLVGDANGGDKAVQKYFAGLGYRNVTVFCTKECRNNLGQWPVRIIRVDRKERDFSFYAAKDRAMAREANCGVMLWDGRSKGTMANVINLLESGKKVLVYFSPDEKFYKLADKGALRNLLQRCNRNDVERATRQLGLTSDLNSLQMQIR